MTLRDERPSRGSRERALVFVRVMLIWVILNYGFAGLRGGNTARNYNAFWPSCDPLASRSHHTRVYAISRRVGPVGLRYSG